EHRGSVRRARRRTRPRGPPDPEEEGARATGSSGRCPPRRRTRPRAAPPDTSRPFTLRVLARTVQAEARDIRCARMDDSASSPAVRATAGVSLALVLLCLAGTLMLGAATKLPCASGDWSGDRQYRLLCYSDI